MLSRLRTRSIGSTLAAIVAAYCLVVQAILAAMLLPGMALAADSARGIAVICHSGSGDGDGPASRTDFTFHASCAVCVQVHATADAAPPSATAPSTAATYARYRVTPYLVRFARRTHEPRSSQGPPQSA